MTWQEFVDFVESKGVKPQDTIDYIDVHCDDADEAQVTLESIRSGKVSWTIMS